jgi:hypothetical protein
MEYAIKAIELDPKIISFSAESECSSPASSSMKRHRISRRPPTRPNLQKDRRLRFAESRSRRSVRGLQQPEKVAAAYEIFRRDSQSQKYNLDFQTQAQLKNDPVTQFEKIGDAFFTANRPELAVKAFRKRSRRGKGKPGVLSVNLAKAYVENQAVRQLAHAAENTSTPSSRRRDASRISFWPTF